VASAGAGVLAHPQPEHEVVERLGQIAPGAKLVADREVVLGAAQTIGLVS
jgi:hypothetical protein